MARLSLFYPVRPFIINQKFGANLPCVRGFGTPQQVIVTGADNNTCPPGYEKLYGNFGMSGHNGTDLRAGVQNVYAACAGTVIEKQTVPARGLGLGILTDEPMDLDENGTYFVKIRYWHLKSFAVDVGDHVKVGTLLGITDNTGYSSGNHLHFEGQPMIKDSGLHPQQARVQSSIAGAINLEPYFNGMYAEGANVPPPPAFKHNFNINMSFGDRRSEVVALQKALTLEEVFPPLQPPTGYYGNLTREAVKKFQVKYNITPVLGICGPKTRARLNMIYGTTGPNVGATPESDDLPNFDAN